MNKLFIKGNLTRDPEIKDINGKKLCKFSVACTNRVRAGQGEFKDETVYLDVTTWEKQADRCSFLRKGSGVFITGRLREEVWTDKTTQQEKKKYVMHPETIDFIMRDPSRGENVGQAPMFDQEEQVVKVRQIDRASRDQQAAPPPPKPQPKPVRYVEEGEHDESLPY